jgi:hypothetical protein
VPALGLVLILLGVWIMLRTVRHNLPLKQGGSGGLVEKILGETK